MLKYIHLFIFLFCSVLSFAQDNGPLIEAVKFDGLKKSWLSLSKKNKSSINSTRAEREENYLRLFIQSNVGSRLDKSTLERDIQQLNRRTGVANATYVIDTIAEDKVNIQFQIQPQRTLIPQFGIGGVNNNFWWQVGAAEYNLGGTGQTLIATYLQNDGQPNGKIFYQNNWIKGSPWGFAAEASRAASIEPLYFSTATVDFLYTNTGAGILGTRNFGYNHQLDAGVNFFRESYLKQNIIDGEPSPGPDSLTQNKLLLKVNFAVNRIGYDYFYRSGHQWNLLGQSVITAGEPDPFFSITFEAKKFIKPYASGNIAFRIRAALASNAASPFAPFVLDSRFNIRGVGNRVDRGTAQFVLNAEFRQTLFHAPRFAAQFVIFADSGTWRNPGGELKDLFNKDQFRQFVGLGIRFIDKKVFRSVFRFDYGFDLWNTQQNGLELCSSNVKLFREDSKKGKIKY